MWFDHMLSVKSQETQYGSELNQIKHGGSRCIFNVSLGSFDTHSHTTISILNAVKIYNDQVFLILNIIGWSKHSWI